jgi:hypothetical protein
MARQQQSDFELGVETVTNLPLHWYIDWPSKLYQQDEVAYFAPKQEQGDFSYEGFLPESAWNRNNWAFGMGHAQFEKPILGRFHHSNGVDTTIRRQLIKGPQAQSVSFGTAGAMLGPPVEFSGNLYAPVGSHIEKSTDGGVTWANVATLGGAIKRLTVGNDWNGDTGQILLAALGEDKAYEYSTNGTSWVASNRSGDDALADDFATLDNRVYKVLVTTDSTPISKVFHSTDPKNSGISWTELGDVGHPDATAQRIVNYDNALIIGKVDGIYSYQGDGTFHHLLDFTSERDAVNCQAMTVGQDGILYFNIRHKIVTFNGQTVLNKSAVQSFSVVGNDINAWDTGAAKGIPQDMTWAQGWLWVTFLNQSGEYFVNRFNPLLVQYPGEGWHTVYAAGSTAMGSLVVSALNGANPYLLCRHGTALIYFILPDSQDNPRQDDNYRYSLADQQVTMEDFDGGLADIPKVILALGVDATIPTGTRVDVAYAIDRSGSYTNLGSVNTTGVKTNLEFPSDTAAKTVALRFTLVTTDATVTPVVRNFTLRYENRPEIRKRWVIPVLIKRLQLITPDRTPETAKEQLESMRQTAFPIPFTDIHDNAFNVIVDHLGPTIEFERQVGEDPQFTYLLHLKEFSAGSGAWYFNAENALFDVAVFS